MKSSRLVIALAAGAASLALVQQAAALESRPPMQPGATTGAPAGALPPAGIYANIDTYYSSGTVVNGEGQNTGIKLAGAGGAVRLLDVPGWRILGASYGAAIIQPFNYNLVNADNIGHSSSYSMGLYNTILTPEILSWPLGKGNFVSEGLSIYLPDGDFIANYSPKTGYVSSPISGANHYWVLEPNLAYSYLKNGWNITLNNSFDFNGTDPKTHYHSGDIYYLDWTIAHWFGRYQIGVVGNYTRQFTNDTRFGQQVINAGGVGDQYMHASAGPIVSYKFHAATLVIRYLYGFAGQNGGNQSFFHIGLNLPLS